ncbi:MAG: hypothetical protein ACLQVF_39740 [Isosphaeraceae bacterium]
MRSDLDTYVDAVFACLQSEFMTLPKGPGFVEYPVFEQGYEELKRATGNFREAPPAVVLDSICSVPVVFIVLRTVLGFTPPEWAYVTTQRTGVGVSQGAIRALDRKIRMAPLTALRSLGGVTDRRLCALVETACEILIEGAPDVPVDILHRLDKADTTRGLASIQPLADLGVPYAMMLYERFLGRPFAGHRDSVSELVGDVLETAIEGVLARAGVSFRKTKRAERVSGFDQAPDFIVPDEFSPKVVVEAKITEDDGTARDKVTRVQHLAALSQKGVPRKASPRFELIACIGGRGFRLRREDMKKLLLATRGKVFTVQNLNRIIECSRLQEFVTSP